MARLARTYPDNTRTTSPMSGDTLPGQTRTYTFRYVQMSGVRTFRREGERSASHRHVRDNLRCRAASPTDHLKILALSDALPLRRLPPEAITVNNAVNSLWEPRHSLARIRRHHTKAGATPHQRPRQARRNAFRRHSAGTSLRSWQITRFNGTNCSATT
jgi:hypothetical protein